MLNLCWTFHQAKNYMLFKCSCGWGGVAKVEIRGEKTVDVKIEKGGDYKHQKTKLLFKIYSVEGICYPFIYKELTFPSSHTFLPL